MVGTGTKPSETVDPELEKVKQQLESMSVEAAKARSKNEALRKQLDKLMQLNENLLAEREDRSRPGNTVDVNTASNGTQTIQTRDNNTVIVQTDQRIINTDGMNVQNNLNLDHVRGILDHFQSLQIPLNLPTYDGEKGNPAEFVEKLEKFFIRKRIGSDQKLSPILNGIFYGNLIL